MINNNLKCEAFPCEDVNKEGYQIVKVKLNPDNVKVFMIVEAMPINSKDYFYSNNSPEYMTTTLQAFNDAECKVNSIEDILNLGFYLTSAIKCAKIGYSISTATIKNCSQILEKEFLQFPNLKVIMLMGDVAIKSFNYISNRIIGSRTIPAGSTYKIRKNEFYYNNIRVFPSYVPVGKNYLIEKSKRKMIAEDIKNAFELIKDF
ncbi:MAG TPA: uracil-DNA glycosylase family protein [candidate division Zixibacteria bacterium]|nr:uracil-DNA glycosylase family protein [candidate division Zixibacteria bacterium]